MSAMVVLSLVRHLWNQNKILMQDKYLVHLETSYWFYADINVHVIYPWFLKNLVNLTWELTHCLGIEHRYYWIAKDIGDVPSCEEGFSSTRKIFGGVYWCMQSRTWRSLYAIKLCSGTKEEFQIIPLDEWKCRMSTMIPMRLYETWRIPYNWHIHFCLILQSTEVVPGYHFCLVLMSTEDSAVEGGGECNTPFLTPFALNIYDVNIVINHGVELKEKSPPSI